MKFIAKQYIEEILNEVIDERNLEERQKIILELKSILKIISYIENSNENFKGIKNMYRLPASKTGYSEYRVIDDTDSEDRSLWVELKDFTLSEGDIIIEMKE